MGKGKGGSPAPYVQQDPTASLQNNSQMFNYMAQMSANNSKFLQSLQAMNDQQTLAKLPEISKTPDIDWSEQEKNLINKAKADYKNSQALKVGRSATFITSPLLDDEEASTTSSSLIGS